MTIYKTCDRISTAKTVEAEIKLMMLPQRAHVAESWVKNKLANGPPRVQSNAVRSIGHDMLMYFCGVFCNVVMCVKRQGYDSILQSAR